MSATIFSNKILKYSRKESPLDKFEGRKLKDILCLTTKKPYTGALRRTPHEFYENIDQENLC